MGDVRDKETLGWEARYCIETFHLNKMNIFLTGGAGYIGSHTIIELD